MKRRETSSRRRGHHGRDPGRSRNPQTTERWLVLDTETTGLHEDRELVEVAVVGADGRLVFASLVRPTRPPSALARRVHGLDDERLREAPEPGTVLAKLTPLLQGRLVYTFGAAFDRRTLDLTYQRQGLATPRCRWSCLRELYVQIRGFSASLRTACEIEAIPVPSGPHRASIDAGLAWQLLKKLCTLSDN
jgi:DNA polymerase III epsilon subunit-like protein